MINFDSLNTLIEFSGFFVGLCSLILTLYFFWKFFNHKEYKSLEHMKTDRLLELYALHKQLLRVKNPTRYSRILTRIDKIEKDIILIDRINWGLDYEEEDSK